MLNPSRPRAATRSLFTTFAHPRSSSMLLLMASWLFAGPVSAQLVINEIMQNPSAVSDASGEWFEIHNPGGSDVDINGWTISDADFDSHVITNGGPLLVPAGGYLVLGSSSDTSSNGGVVVDYVYSGVFLANGADELVLEDGSTIEIDRVEWDGGPGFPDPSGASMALVAPGLDNSVGSNWCTAVTAFGDGDLGTPGAANDCPPPLVINEILADPDSVSGDSNNDGTVSTTQDEFVEIYNQSGSALDISGWTISDGFSPRHVFPADSVIPAGCAVVVFGGGAPTGDFGGSLTQVASSGALGLNNSGDDVSVSDGAGFTASTSYGSAGGDNQSLTRDPDISGPDTLVKHSLATGSGGALFSPGTRIDGSRFAGCPTPPTPGGLVINEIDYDQSGTDTAEFVEIKNTGSEAVPLGTYALEFVNGSTGSVYRTIYLPEVSLGAGDFFVVCGDAANVYGCDLDVSPDTNLIQNGSPDAVALVNGATLVDTVSYEGDVAIPYTETSGVGLFDSTSAFVGISRIPDGADTNVNNVDFDLACITPGFANSSVSSDCTDPAPPALRINEIDYDQPGTDAAEFIEIINAGNASADLSGVELVLVNGSSDTVYNTIALPAQILAAGDYFVVCANAATVQNCDLDVTPDTNLVQNGAPDAVALIRGSDILDAVSYEGDVAAPYVEGSGVGLSDSPAESNKSISRVPSGSDSGQNNVDFAFVCITPGAANTFETSGCSSAGPVREIYQIQGDGLVSPFVGQGVATEDNVVTAVGPSGFFMQTPAVRTDGDPDTSDGIFVFTGSAPTVSVGDLVDVSGEVQEFFDFTEFAAGSVVTVAGAGALPAPVVFDETIPSPDPAAASCAIEFECYEGMLVEISEGVVTGPNQRFGSDVLAEVFVTAAPARTFREPGIEYPGLAGYPEWDGNPEVFELDPDRLGLPNQVIPAGSGFSATGVLGYEFGGYELWPTRLDYTPASLPVPVRARAANEMTVGGLNLFRLFQADANYGLRRAKLASYILDVLAAPDVLMVSEAENVTVLDDLAGDILAVDPTVVYSAFLIEGNDLGGIDVGFLVRDTVEVDAVTQLGASELLTYDENLLHDRPPLLLEGRQVADGSDFPFAVLAIHGRSLSGIEDPDDGERVRRKRFEQAQSVAAMVNALQTADPDVNLVVIGDFNAFEFTDGYVDVVGQVKGDYVPADNLVCENVDCTDLVEPDLVNQVLMIPAAERYSFIFRGNAQVLDHALTSAGLDELVRDFQIARGNSDAAVDLINDGSTPLRSSDHDGLVLFLAKDSDGDGVTDDLDACPGTIIPEGAGQAGLGKNRWALVDDDRVFDTRSAKGGGPNVSYNIFDTMGCSCEQIVEAWDLGDGHLKRGCSISVMEGWVYTVGQL